MTDGSGIIEGIEGNLFTVTAIGFEIIGQVNELVILNRYTPEVFNTTELTLVAKTILSLVHSLRSVVCCATKNATESLSQKVVGAPLAVIDTAGVGLMVTTSESEAGLKQFFESMALTK